MKYIYKLSFLMLTVFAFTSCNVDDDDPVTVPAFRNVTASFAIQRDAVAIADDSESYDLVINFSEALPSYSTIEYTLGGVTTTINGNTGANSIAIPLSFPNGVNSQSVSINDFVVVNSAARRVTPVISGVTSTTVARQGYFSATMNWASAVFDLDLGLQPMTPTWVDTFLWIDTSLGVTSQEFVEGEELADGNYALFIQHFTTAAPVDVTFSIVSAAGLFTFNLTTVGDGNHLWFTKSTDGSGNVSYTFFETDPA